MYLNIPIWWKGKTKVLITNKKEIENFKFGDKVIIENIDSVLGFKKTEATFIEFVERITDDLIVLRFKPNFEDYFSLHKGNYRRRPDLYNGIDSYWNFMVGSIKISRKSIEYKGEEYI